MQPKPTQNLDELLGIESEFHAPTVAEEPPPEPDEAQFTDEVPEVEIVARRRGRPKGSINVRKQATKSSVTQQRLALEAGLRDYMEHPNRRLLLRDAFDRILRVAAYGIEDKDAISAMRVLLDKFMSTAKQEEEAAGNAPPQVHIVIENATARVAPPAIDAQFTEVKGK
jgi:hypothetical protein